ncbi:MAG: hypothetical protein QME52_09760 [Bacteroidota bacterium]|nr:hypothetical protein [Bacteroidota bacterium]
MKQSLLFWLLAFLITAGTLVYQRVTGPTYPLSDKVMLNGKEISYILNRTHPGETNHSVKIETNDEAVTGYLLWKRHKTADEWKEELMLYNDGVLTAELPHQPPAGKLNYQIILNSGNDSITIPENKPVVIRFRGDVPSVVLIIHILAMFIGLLLSTRAGFECLRKEPKLKQITIWTIIVTAVGGLILGPIMQWYAFGAFWTGFPFGIDLTDNKTALALLFWIIAAIALRRSKIPERWVLAAAIITLIVYLIPHSVLGSELDYSKEQQQTIQSP